MTYTQLQDRFFQLTDVIKETSGTDYFTSGQRICLHQERASIMRAMEELYDENLAYNNHPDNEELPVPEGKPKYVVPKHLNQKIENLINNP